MIEYSSPSKAAFDYYMSNWFSMLVPRPAYPYTTRSMPLLPMPWFFLSPGHQYQRYFLFYDRNKLLEYAIRCHQMTQSHWCHQEGFIMHYSDVIPYTLAEIIIQLPPHWRTFSLQSKFVNSLTVFLFLNQHFWQQRYRYNNSTLFIVN